MAKVRKRLQRSLQGFGKCVIFPATAAFLFRYHSPGIIYRPITNERSNTVCHASNSLKKIEGAFPTALRRKGKPQRRPKCPLPRISLHWDRCKTRANGSACLVVSRIPLPKSPCILPCYAPTQATATRAQVLPPLAPRIAMPPPRPPRAAGLSRP